MSECGKDPKEHCCWVAGKPCPYLRTTSKRVQKEEGFYWRCDLRTKLGSWAAVHRDHRYIDNVKPVWIHAGIPDCGDWPNGRKVKGTSCSICGIEDKL